MHVAVFTAYYPPHVGGVEVVAQTIARGLAQRHRVTVITTACGSAAGVQVEEGVEVHRLDAIDPMGRSGVPYSIPGWRGLRRVLRALQGVDVCHAHGALYPTTLLARAVAKRQGCPLVLTEHVGFVEYRSGILNRLQAAAWRIIGDRTVVAASRVTVVSGRVRAWLMARFPAQSITLVPNGVDLEAFSPRNPADVDQLRESFGLPLGEPLVLFVGRAAEKKNLVAALTLASGGCTVVVCGAPRRITSDRVIDLGIVPHPHMPALLACVDLMLLPSRGEGFPVAAQEALAAGLPLVLLWDPGYAELLDRRLVAAVDAEADLDQAVRGLLADREARLAAAAQGRKWALAHWGMDTAVGTYQRLYEEALTTPSGPLNEASR